MEDPNDKSLYRGGSWHSPLHDVDRQGREHPAGAGGGRETKSWLRLERGVSSQPRFFLCTGCLRRCRSRDSSLTCLALENSSGCSSASPATGSHEALPRWSDLISRSVRRRAGKPPASAAIFGCRHRLVPPPTSSEASR